MRYGPALLWRDNKDIQGRRRWWGRHARCRASTRLMIK
jgi:hypothetical protein